MAREGAFQTPLRNCSWAIVFILLQINLGLQLSHCAFFKKRKVNSFTATMKKGPRVDFLPLLQLYKELEPWYQQRPLVPIYFLGEPRQIWVSFLWFWDLSCWLMILSFIWQ